MRKRLGLAVWCLAFVLGCDRGGQQAVTEAPGEGGTGSSDAVILATIDGEAITEQDIEDKVARELSQIRQDLYQARKSGVDQLIDEKLLGLEAKRQGVSVDEFLKKEVRDKIKVSDKEIKDFYEERKQRFGDKSFDEVKGLIGGFVEQQKFAEGQNELLAKLRKKANIKFHIEPPRMEVATGDYPAIGPESAPVTIVEFSDYQCPFCGRSRATVNQILDTYGKKVRYVFRDFPLSFHQDAFKAHEAAHCAGEQGKYWEYNRKLFNSQRELKVDDLNKYARELKLNAQSFTDCLDSGKYRQKVQESLNYGQSVGVSGTPAFFVNGRLISGARPFTSFQEVIDDELSRVN